MKILHITNKKAWRLWLARHHKTEDKAAVVAHKKHTGKPAPTHRELIEEAICFGWIDTIIKRVDSEKYRQCFVKRNKNGRWSNNTLRYAKQMITQGKMHPQG